MLPKRDVFVTLDRSAETWKYVGFTMVLWWFSGLGGFRFRWFSLLFLASFMRGLSRWLFSLILAYLGAHLWSIWYHNASPKVLKIKMLPPWCPKVRPGRSNGGLGGVIWEVFEVSWEGLGYQLGNSCGCKASTDKVRHVIAKTARIVLARMHFIWNFPLGCYEVEAARSAARDRSGE